MKGFVPLILAGLFLLPLIVGAHGFVADGHDGSLRPIDFIELGAITLGSLGLLVYSFKQYKKEKRK